MKFDFFAKSGKHIGHTSITGNKKTAKVTRDVLRKSGGRLTIKTLAPIIDAHGFWTPDLLRPKMQLLWTISLTCAAHRNFPFISFFSMGHINRFSAGLTNLLDDARVSAAMNQEKCVYEVAFEIAVTRETGEFEIFLDAEDKPWTEALDAYRKAALPGGTPAYPDCAWDPVYCTWYAVHASVEKKWLEANAAEAARLGFKTFIVDDGWCFDDMKRVTPETITNWYENIGSWEVSKKKLPGFKDHVRKVQKTGMRYMLWVAPFFVGTKSPLKKGVAKFLSKPHEGYQVFDTADKKTSDKMIRKMRSLVADNGLDGLKIDFIDSIPQDPDNPRGRPTFDFVQKMISAIREDRPDAMFEFRQCYSTPVMLSLGTQFRAGDVPFDFIENLHRIAQIRIVVGDRVPAHADPAYWGCDETPVNISRHMICALAGTPMLSMDLEKLPASQKSIVKFWTDFYNKNIETYKTGKWKVAYEFENVAHMSVEKKGVKIIILVNPDKLGEAVGKFKGKCHILNMSTREISLGNAMAVNCLGKAAKNGKAPCGGMLTAEV